MLMNRSAPPGAIVCSMSAATHCQCPVSAGATHTPYTPSSAPALSGWVQVNSFRNPGQLKTKKRTCNEKL